MDEADEESEATPIAPIVNELSRPVVNLTRPTREKEGKFDQRHFRKECSA